MTTFTLIAGCFGFVMVVAAITPLLIALGECIGKVIISRTR